MRWVQAQIRHERSWRNLVVSWIELIEEREDALGLVGHIVRNRYRRGECVGRFLAVAAPVATSLCMRLASHSYAAARTFDKVPKLAMVGVSVLLKPS